MVFYRHVYKQENKQSIANSSPLSLSLQSMHAPPSHRSHRSRKRRSLLIQTLLLLLLLLETTQLSALLQQYELLLRPLIAMIFAHVRLRLLPVIFSHNDPQSLFDGGLEWHKGGIPHAIASGAFADNLFGPCPQGVILCGFQTLEENLDKQKKIFLFVAVVGRRGSGVVVIRVVVRICPLLLLLKKHQSIHIGCLLLLLLRKIGRKAKAVAMTLLLVLLWQLQGRQASSRI